MGKKITDMTEEFKRLLENDIEDPEEYVRSQEKALKKIVLKEKGIEFENYEIEWMGQADIIKCMRCGGDATYRQRYGEGEHRRYMYMCESCLTMHFLYYGEREGEYILKSIK